MCVVGSGGGVCVCLCVAGIGTIECERYPSLGGNDVLSGPGVCKKPGS